MLLAGCEGGHEHELVLVEDEGAPRESPSVLHKPPPPLSAGVFPCGDCHDPEIPFNVTRRELKVAHQEIRLRHGDERLWCFDCHDPTSRDDLRLASGATVPLEESHRLCGQCHGSEHRDWSAGVHGLCTGRWDGEKKGLLCAHCHDAHAPAFPSLVPMPAPEPPRRTP
jgi:Zn finger protein HypA/HybF involved in hydrogenase expression